MAFYINNGTEVVANGATALEALESMCVALCDIDEHILAATEFDSPDGWFSLHFNVDGVVFDEAAFFSQLEYSKDLTHFLEDGIVLALAERYQNDDVIYTHEELETGSAAAEYVATQSAGKIWVYHEFLKALDLEHTVEQIEVVGRLIELHGRDEMVSVIDWLQENGRVLFESIVAEPKTKVESFPLHAAIYADDVEAVKVALAANPPLDVPNNDDRIPIHCLSGAVTDATLQILDLLLEAGADVDGRNHKGETTLHKRVGRVDWLGIATRLLDAGADPNARSAPDGSWPRGGSRTPIFGALELPLMELLIERGASLDVVDSIGQTPVHALVGIDSAEDAVRLALASGCDPMVADERGWTALHKAASNTQTQMIRILLDVGADKDLKNDQGKTPYDLGRIAWPRD